MTKIIFCIFCFGGVFDFGLWVCGMKKPFRKRLIKNRKRENWVICQYGFDNQNDEIGNQNSETDNRKSKIGNRNDKTSNQKS